MKRFSFFFHHEMSNRDRGLDGSRRTPRSGKRLEENRGIPTLTMTIRRGSHEQIAKATR
jgi:hypothetical protein